MGDMHPDFGQAYWGSVEEQDMPVRFNMKQIVDFVPGRKFTAEESEMRRSKPRQQADGSFKEGRPYTQLKKVKVSQPITQTADVPDFSEADMPNFDGLEGVVDDRVEPIALPALDDSDETPSYEAGTNARWALKLSTDTFKSVLGRVPEDGADFLMIEDFAKRLLGSFQQLKNYNPKKDEE